MATTSAAPRKAAAPREGQTYRFNLAERIAHWNHALTFLILLFTGLALVVRGVATTFDRDLLLMFGQAHRGVAILFTAVTIPVLLVGARKASGEWVRSSFWFDKDDRTFLLRFYRDFFGLPVQLPPQGRFNAGEKINSIMQILGWPVMVISGWMLVFKDQLPPTVAQVTVATHSMTALVLGCAVLGHIYLAAIHPHSRPGISGMISGWVPSWWARGHYRKWYDSGHK
ncbi:MAG TPA: cytochrome b/b6 domain-containing protein [Symbiobacteriaceae bacterium]|nr:cytochrome b/b6 domain-containing protein [Symbiobacteriaceae bacterium]